MKKALLLRVEMYWKGAEQPATVSWWNILPEHVQSNVRAAATRNEILVKAYTVTEDDPVATRKAYFDFDGTIVHANPDYEGVRHFEDKRDTVS